MLYFELEQKAPRDYGVNLPGPPLCGGGGSGRLRPQATTPTGVHFDANTDVPLDGGGQPNRRLPK